MGRGKAESKGEGAGRRKKRGERKTWGRERSPSHHFRATNDNSSVTNTGLYVGPQELKYPGAEARSERMGGQGGAAEGGADAGASPSALGAPGLDRVGFQRLLGPWAGDWHLLGEGEGPAAIGGSAVFICTIEEAAVWLLIQKRIF